MKKILKILLIIFVVIQLIPYLIPLSTYRFTPTFKPFDNSHYLTFNEGGVDYPLHYRLDVPMDQVVKGKVLLVHGLGASTESFDENVPALVAEGYLVVSVDLPGFGYSVRGRNLDHSQLNRSVLLWQLLDALDGSAEDSIAQMDWTLAGHSLGGGTVAAMAAERADRTAGLILIDGALGEMPRRGDLLLAYPPISRWVSVVMEHVVITEARVEGFLTSAFGRAPTEDELKDYLWPLTFPGTARGVSNFVRTSKGYPMENLSAFTGPVLAIWGAEDSWVPVSEMDRIATYLPQLERFVIEGAGHCPNETHVGAFNERMIDFLRGII